MRIWSGSLLEHWHALVRSLWQKFQRVRGYLPTKRWCIEKIVSEADEVPSEIPNSRAFLVGTATLRKWLVFDCPCNKGHRIVLNLDSNKTPYWQLKVSIFGRITLSPSVNYLGGNTACHYFLKQGRVIWARV